MSVLRVYLPAECDEGGVPLDWEKCRTCKGERELPMLDGGLMPRPADVPRPMAPCPSCEGHGSLKRAALDHWQHQAPIPASFDSPITIPREVRCEGCGHPMSDGTWEGRRPPIEAGYDAEGFALNALRRGDEPDFLPLGYGVHYSPCDEGCRHGGPGIQALCEPGGWTDFPLTYEVGLAPVECRASWRQVDVRCLSWPHDLRPEMLAVLCLRCYAERGK